MIKPKPKGSSEGPKIRGIFDSKPEPPGSSEGPKILVDIHKPGVFDSEPEPPGVNPPIPEPTKLPRPITRAIEDDTISSEPINKNWDLSDPDFLRFLPVVIWGSLFGTLEKPKSSNKDLQDNEDSDLTITDLGIFMGGGVLPSSKIKGIFFLPRVFRRPVPRAVIARSKGKKNNPRGRKGGKGKRPPPTIPFKFVKDVTAELFCSFVYIYVVKLENGLFVIYVGKAGGEGTSKLATDRVGEMLKECLRFTQEQLLLAMFDYATPNATFSNWKFLYALSTRLNLIEKAKFNADEIKKYFRVYVARTDRNASPDELLNKESNVIEELVLHGTVDDGDLLEFLAEDPNGGRFLVVNNLPWPFDGNANDPQIVQPEFLLKCQGAELEQVRALTDSDQTNLHRGTSPADWLDVLVPTEEQIRAINYVQQEFWRNLLEPPD